MRKRARVDDNQVEIVRALRGIGCSVQSLATVGSGCPDILVGYRGRNTLMEIKDGRQSPSRRPLTPAQVDWHRAWAGQVAVVLSPREALACILAEN